MVKNLLWADPSSDPTRLCVGFGGDIPIFPPLAAVLLIVTGLVMTFLTGFSGSFIPLLTTPVRVVIAVTITLLALVLKKSCEKALNEVGTKARFTPVSAVADTGPYAFCRNPMYWALIVPVGAIGIGLDTMWITVGSTALLWLYLDTIVVPAEETYLQRQLGDSYKQYCASVKRWAPI